MINPYDPPTTDTSQPVSARKRSFFLGGFGLVTLLALLIGGGVGMLLSSPNTSIPFYVWGVPAVGWFVALAILICIMRSSRFSAVGDLLLALALVVPAYILYVPVCTVSSMLTQGWIPSKDYGPAPTGIVIGSAFAFTVILLSIAAILRISFRVPAHSAAPVPGKANDRPPDNEYI